MKPSYIENENGDTSSHDGAYIFEARFSIGVRDVSVGVTQLIYVWKATEIGLCLKL